VFNIAGNKYRIVVWINYPYRVVYVRLHRQYDKIDAQNRFKVDAMDISPIKNQRDYRKVLKED